MKAIQITTEDNYKLHAHLFEPRKDKGKFLIINSATGVKQQLYFGIAQYLSQHGIRVITYDYRGIGLSKPHSIKGFSATMRDWGTKDYAAVANFMLNEYSHEESHLMGHSVGALILGMHEVSKKFEDFIFIATQNPYYPYLDYKTRLFAMLGFGLLEPVVSRTLGYFPGHWFGLGETLPKGCSHDWRSLIMKASSTDFLLQKLSYSVAKELTQSVLFLQPKDDTWISDKGIQSLMTDTYPKMTYQLKMLDPKDSQKNEIGHVNFFRRYNSNLWKIVLERILR